jgi:hypothetical protein
VPTRLLLSIAAGVFAALLVVAGAAIVRIATDKGELVIESEDPDVEIVVSQGGKQVLLIDTRTKRQIKLASGTYQIELARGGDGLSLSTDHFSLSRGGREIVRVQHKPAAALRPPSAPTPPGPAPGPAPAAAPPAVATDRKPQQAHGRAWIEGAELVVQPNDKRAGFVALGDLAWDDYDISFEARGDCVVYFRATDVDNYWGFQVRPHGSDYTYLLGVTVAGKVTRAAQQDNVPGGRADGWNTISISMRGPQCWCFFNHKEVCRHSDPRNPRGLVALGAWPGVARFRNLLVKDGGGRELFRGLPELPAPSGDNGATSAPAEGGFVSLFNGRDLSGWHVDGGHPEQWSAEGGAIAGSSKHFSTRNYLLTDKEYADYVLRFEFQVEGPGNHGGVAVRAVDGERVPLNRGFIFDHPIVKLIGPRQASPEVTGTTHWVHSAAAYVRPVEVSSPPAGAWQAMEVVVRGKTCTATLGGRQIVNVTLDQGAPRSGTFVPALGRARGRVGFQINTGTLRFRKVQIKELTPALAAGDGFVALFNGNDLAGWQTDPRQRGNWRVEHGVLVGSGPASVSHLYTERGDYRDFHLRVEARINGGGNSGVFFRAPLGPRWPAGAPRFPMGYEAQIYASGDARQPATGSLFVDDRGPQVLIREPPAAAGEWFTMEVIAQGNHIVIKVNGKTTADYTETKRPLTSGHLALQQLGPATVVECRNIEIKELPAGTSP